MPPPPFLIEDGPHGRTLVVTGKWSARAEAMVSRGEVSGLVINYARGSQERTLDFLSAWPLERLHVLVRTITDISPVYRLAETLQ